MAEDFITDIGMNAKIEYKKVKRILELNPKVFRPCEIKEFEKGVLRKQVYFIHFDGKRWDIIRISGSGIERYILK
ncbi:MAG: hypothetical protein DSY37_02655 [Hyperthermus sp.]|nr:MAG: hypothetical protein DSY37_02655 [Hyperthermus sp.]